VHPLVQHYRDEHAIDFALTGGDDYELCFTTSQASLEHLISTGLDFVCIGKIESEQGLRAKNLAGNIVPIQVKGYSHF